MKTEPFGNKKANKILLSYLSSLSHFEGLFTGEDETKKQKGTRTLAQCSTFRKKSRGQLAPKFFGFWSPEQVFWSPKIIFKN